jgi:hypothetical protein
MPVMHLSVPRLITQCEPIEEILAPHRAAAGQRYEGIRNHAFRLLNIAGLLAPPDDARTDKLAVVAAFHDLPALLDGDLVYLARAADLAEAHLRARGRTAWAAEVRLAICNHHKVSTYRGPYAGLVEAVRRADWVDVSGGTWRAGLPRSYVRELGAAFPLGPLLRPGWCLIARYAVRHPRRPLPMLRW